MTHRHIARYLAVLLALGLVAAACSGGGDDEAASETVCPTNLVIQTDWWPEIEHIGTYQLIGPNGTSDPETFRYSGPIQEQYKVGGIETVEIRAGGDAISFSPVTSVMYEDSDITLGYVNTSDAAKDAGTNAVIGVAKTLDINPQMVMWNPAQYDISEPADMAATGARFLYFDGSTYVDFIVSSGFMTEDQLDPSYAGAPDQFIESNGGLIQQGFATNEIYKYENEIEWNNGAPADVEFFLIHDLGFEDYPAMYSVRADRLAELTPCLELLVPKLAQAWVDFYADPGPIADALISLNAEYNTYWELSTGINDKAYEMFTDGIMANSPDGTYCSMDEGRVNGLIDILKPTFDNRGIQYPDDLSAATVVDNSFCAGAPGLS